MLSYLEIGDDGVVFDSTTPTFSFSTPPYIPNAGDMTCVQMDFQIFFLVRILSCITT